MPSSHEANDRYPFLHSHIAREPHLVEVLDEIYSYQKDVAEGRSTSLANLDTLRHSRKITIPFTPGRNKNISYILDLLIKNYPQEFRPIITFRFKLDENRKLSIDETYEMTVLMTSDIYNKIQRSRDEESMKSLLDLLKQFRLFNLTKLAKHARSRKELSRLIKTEIGKTIFTFKNYSTDKNGIETSDDFCFHRDNYEAVKKGLSMETLEAIIQTHEEPVKRRLKRFGILTPTFSDYRDSKLDYILSILLEEIAPSLGPKDLAEVKNFHATRECLRKVDQVMDPVVTKTSDIINLISEQQVCRASDIISLVEEMNEDLLKQWTEKVMDRDKITMATDATGSPCYVSNPHFIPLLKDLYDQILVNRERLAALDASTRQQKKRNLEFLYATGKGILQGSIPAGGVLAEDEKKTELSRLIHDIDREYGRSEVPVKVHHQERKPSIIERFIGFFSSLFGGKPKVPGHPAAGGTASSRGTGSSPVKRASLSKETRNLVKEIQSNPAPLIPLSDLVDVTETGEGNLSRIISELRTSNFKIVIPMYNARKNLYPNRSSRYLMADVEYLLVDPQVAESMESVNQFIDTITGTKIKDETIPVPAILGIEKYLTTQYRQKRSRKKL